ncbi:SurA N-terminal domain-containing protein [Limimaricola sp. G21655-S1]|uniref:SurA N-terminal domain-containing protein n=1 Tax=Limimaricola sp. G21655-S1 TaxID=3014768 RepID=UPI0022AF1E8D|nr:SurA N-terminal domain-containing protein [Limimaricola sp. G21655-S1]MCZ4260595.1 SurA N-terminal domain-containing protein [Limimaricola sp. G21655-S1]
MTRIRQLLHGTALTAAFGLGLVAVPALAQENQSQDQQSQQGQDASAQAQDNRKVATVNGTDIVTSDLMRFVDMLPDQLRRSQPPEMVISAAIQQLVMRELILEEARSANLAENDRVKQLVAQSTIDAEDDAMIQVWLEQEFEDDITDEAVQGAYDALQATNTQELPPLEKVRPQIEQQLRQQAYADLQTQLQQSADIVFYDASGNAVTPQSGSGQNNGSDAAANSGESSDSGQSSNGANSNSTNESQSSDGASTSGSDSSNSNGSSNEQNGSSGN